MIIPIFPVSGKSIGGYYARGKRKDEEGRRINENRSEIDNRRQLPSSVR